MLATSDFAGLPESLVSYRPLAHLTLVQKTKELTKAARPNAKLRAENRRLLEQMTGVPTLDPGVSAYVPGVPVLAGPTCWVRCAICRKDADPFTAFSGAELANGAARRCKQCLPGQ